MQTTTAAAAALATGNFLQLEFKHLFLWRSSKHTHTQIEFSILMLNPVGRQESGVKWVWLVVLPTCRLCLLYGAVNDIINPVSTALNLQNTNTQTYTRTHTEYHALSTCNALPRLFYKHHALRHPRRVQNKTIECECKCKCSSKTCFCFGF